MARTTFQVQRTITSMVENKKEPKLTYALNAFIYAHITVLILLVVVMSFCFDD